MRRLGFLLVLALSGGCDDAAPSDGGYLDAAARDGGGAAPDGGGTDGGGDADGGGGMRDAGPPRDAGSPPAGVAERARALAMELRDHPHFLFGLGNDLDGAPTYDPNRAGAYTLGTTLDVHYWYVTGYSDRGGWSTWNADGSFVRIHGDAAASHGVVPMVTYYQLALDYETGADTLQDTDRMGVWWSDVRLMFQRLNEVRGPSLVHFEPDLFGYLEQRFEGMGTTPGAYPMRIPASVSECAGMAEVAASLGPCLAALRDAHAPRARIGLHASRWGAWYDETDPSADIEASARSVAGFLAAMGGSELDFVVVETSDRDAGFWETYGGMAGMCSVTDGPRGAVYWDATNATLPNFDGYLRWVRGVTEALGLPALFWQTPLGVPSDTCGGTDEHYRDNRVRYFFDHVDELVAAGGVGAVFGTGAGRQTYITTDGDQFRDAVTSYFASPFGL
ncbi:MAG: hypothetical protein R3B82_22720 [Sandaracinaceae bacterium]